MGGHVREDSCPVCTSVSILSGLGVTFSGREPPLHLFQTPAAALCSLTALTRSDCRGLLTLGMTLTPRARRMRGRVTPCLFPSGPRSPTPALGRPRPAVDSLPLGPSLPQVRTGPLSSTLHQRPSRHAENEWSLTCYRARASHCNHLHPSCLISIELSSRFFVLIGFLF